MKMICTTFFLLLLFLGSYAQKTINNKNSDYSNLKFAVLDHYKPNSDSLKQSCWKGCVFIRFEVNHLKKIDKISYTITTPLFVQQALDTVFEKINKSADKNKEWTKEVTGKTILLPIIITHDNGCGFATAWKENTNSIGIDNKTKLIYEKRQADFDQFDTSIQNITNFNHKGQINLLNYVILPTIVFPTTMH